MPDKTPPLTSIFNIDTTTNWMEETGLFALEAVRLKREKSKRIAELKERGKELQIVLRKIKVNGGRATKYGSDKFYIVKGSFRSDLFDPKIGNYEIKKVQKHHIMNPELADELEKIYNLTYGYYATVLAQLAGTFETLCKEFWQKEKEIETNDC
jgi:hypothetical protein